MKKIICIIFSLCVLSSVYAEEIPYELLTNRMIEKLQAFGLRSIDYYSMNLYSSNDTESLIKTRRKIESFYTNKEACGKFIYYWWYMWTPMSERGFVENVYMTPSEAYDCCKIGNAIYNANQILEQKAREQAAREREIEAKRKTEEEISQYSKWIEEGIPTSITPNQPAKLKIYAGDGFVQYICDKRSENTYKKSISIKIGADGKVSCVSSDENDNKILELLNIEVVSPACYVFENSGLSVPMESIGEIDLIEKRQRVRTSLVKGQYEASVKFNKKASIWEAEITKYFLDVWREDTKSNRQGYYDAIIVALNKLPSKPKKFIKFHMLDSSIDINCSNCTLQYSNTGRVPLLPIVIIDSTQSGFAKACNW